MKEILLIIALAIAIVMDVIRIHQYRLATGRNRKKFIKEIVMKVIQIYGDWLLSNERNEKGSFEDYAVKHWEDEE